MSTSHTDIPDEAVEAAAMAFANAQYGDAAWDEILIGSTRQALRDKARAVLSAALPVVLASRGDTTGEDVAAKLADVWPDPFGHWTAEEAEAARAMKRALLSHLPLPASRDSETAALRASVGRLIDERDEVQRTVVRQMRKIGDLVSEIEHLRDMLITEHVHTTKGCGHDIGPMEVEGASECAYCGTNYGATEFCPNRCDVARVEHDRAASLRGER